MRDSGRGGRRPTVLIGSHQQSSSSSLESILVPSGYSVIKAYTGAQALERAGSAQPDVIILDSMLPERDGLSVCRELRRDPLFANTPIIIISPDHVTRQERIGALRSGAWDHLGAPLDAEHLLLKIETFARTKLEADRAREEGLLDQGTGLYNLRGLARRAQELASQASRQNAGFACVVFAPAFGDEVSPTEPGDKAIEEAVDQLASALRAAGRQSDAIGHVGPTEFAVVAFGTDAAGSVKLAERLRDAVYGGESKPFRLRAGYCVVPDSRARPADAAATVLQAAAALRKSHSDPAGSWIRAFPEVASDAAASV
jgi:PleD family two-component response regulator